MTDAQHLTPGQPSSIPELPNLRDLGGWEGVGGGKVRFGRLYRSTDFRALTADKQPLLAPLGLRTIYDLRSVSERELLPDPVLEGVADVPLDVLADVVSSYAGDTGKILSDPTALFAAVKQLDTHPSALITVMGETYRSIVSSTSAIAAYRRFYLGLLGEDHAPALFHCTTGKDRTGWAAASFLTLMGVARDDVYADYLLTNERLVPALKPLFDEFAAAGGDPDDLLPVLGVNRAYLDAAFDEMSTTYGSITGYFTEGLGIDAAAQERLRESFLQ